MQSIIEQMFSGVSVSVQYIRTYADNNVVKNKVLEFFNRTNQMIFRRINDDTLKIEVGDNDIDVNATKEKKLTNLRAAGKDENVILTPVKKMTLEHALHFVREDELVEVTPLSIRLRKVELSAQKRYQMAGAKKKG